MTTTIVLAATIYHHIITNSFFMLRNLTYSLSNIQVYDTVLLAIISMLCI